MTDRRASCSCGQLSASAKGDPVRISMCHCFDCQRRTGSVFGVQARFAKGDVSVSGESREFVRVADSGNTIRFRFCPNCGATVHYTLDDQPDLVAIPVGAFADPDFPAPAFSVYESRRHHWIDVPAIVEHRED